MAKVFLGGTVNGSTWRKELIPLLKIDYFDPVVDDWDEAAFQRELLEREHCDYCLYVITPKLRGVYSIAEAVDDSNKRPGKTLFCFLNEDQGLTFDSHQLKALKKTAQMIEENGGKVFDSLADLASFLNKSG